MIASPLETVSKLSTVLFESGTHEQTSRQVMERLKVDAEPLVAQPQPAELAEARQRALDHVAPRAQSAAVRVVVARGQEADDAQHEQQRDHRGGAVGAVTDQRVGLGLG